jgi:hypothetical protein
MAAEREWRYVNGTTKSSDGWALAQNPAGRWDLAHDDGRRVHFETSGGLYLAIDVANAYLDGRTAL